MTHPHLDAAWRTITRRADAQTALGVEHRSILGSAANVDANRTRRQVVQRERTDRDAVGGGAPRRTGWPR
jgi:hypothetical protein